VAVQIGFRQAKTTPTITQDQRLAWLKELLAGDSESLPYRVRRAAVALCPAADQDRRTANHWRTRC
jgi:hypothetical protein